MKARADVSMPIIVASFDARRRDMLPCRNNQNIQKSRKSCAFGHVISRHQAHIIFAQSHLIYKRMLFTAGIIYFLHTQNKPDS